MRISLFTILIAAFGTKGVESHGTEVRTCITTEGKIRMFVEHWHGDLSSVSGAGTMTLLDEGVRKIAHPSGYLNNIKPSKLPGCNNGKAPKKISDCKQRYNDWVYYDFDGKCGSVEVSLEQGNTLYLTEGCKNLYPATFKGTFKDKSPPEILVNGQTCKQGMEINVNAKKCAPEKVTFTVDAKDDCDANPTLTVTPLNSGEVFPLGKTTVTASAADDSGKTATCTFDVNLISPTNCGAFGDPHIRPWDGEMYDFHGICDLVLVHNPDFGNGLGMDIHIRSKKTRQWSYVETAALRIGNDVLEVMGGNKQNYWINKVYGEKIDENMVLSQSLSGYPIKFKKTGKKTRWSEFQVDLGNNEMVIMSAWNTYVSVDMKVFDGKSFAGSIGLMGSYATNAKVGRDNSTVFDELDKFGQEWQVLSDEPKLFHNIEGPQSPSHCEIPSASEMRIRLSESTILVEDAEDACARVGEENFDVCVFDVMAANDRDVAGAY